MAFLRASRSVLSRFTTQRSVHLTRGGAPRLFAAAAAAADDDDDSSAAAKKRVAVVLSGSGVYDGSEITEAVSTTIHLSRAGAETHFFAPNEHQLHTVNHLTGDVVTDDAKAGSSARNVLEESARIARGDIRELDQLHVHHFDAVIFPGGFGAAKNLSSFAIQGDQMQVLASVERVVRDFHKAKKPQGFCCIAPVIPARLIPGVEVTVGHDASEPDRELWPYADTATAIVEMGATHIARDLDQVHVDSKAKIVTAPAYMCNAEPHKVYESVGNMVDKVLALC